MTGAKLGTWILGPEIGRGTLGVVYRAASEDGNRSAAVKVLTHEATRTPDFLQRFPGDMLKLQRLDHQNIARYYDCGVIAGSAYYASELVEGNDTGALLRLQRKPDQPGLHWRELVLSVAVQTARALVHGHHRATLHRDIKPSNVMMTPEGVVKLTDFGVAKIIGIPALTLPSDPFGTVGYLAPEFFSGKPVTRRADLYALGGLLYTLVTGRPPFTAASVSEFMHKHCYQLPDRPIQFVPKLPPEFDDLICNLLAKDPGRRPATAAVVINALEHIRGKAERKGEVVVWPAPEAPNSDLGVVPDDHESAKQAMNSPGRRRPLLTRSVVLWPSLLLVLSLGLFLTFRPRPTAEELFVAAQQRLDSDDPEEWDRAWEDYLVPLTERFPGRYEKEIKDIRLRIRDRKRLRAQVAEGTRWQPLSESERLYQRGLAFAQSGDMLSAKRLWLALSQMPEPTEKDVRWVELAKYGIANVDRTLAATPAAVTHDAAIDAAIERIKQLRSEGNNAAAEAEKRLLLELYADDPAALARLHAER